jgi:hypothetical protein
MVVARGLVNYKLNIKVCGKSLCASNSFLRRQFFFFDKYNVYRILIASVSCKALNSKNKIKINKIINIKYSSIPIFSAIGTEDIGTKNRKS